jgi:hypothetical protein
MTWPYIRQKFVRSSGGTRALAFPDSGEGVTLLRRAEDSDEGYRRFRSEADHGSGKKDKIPASERSASRSRSGQAEPPVPPLFSWRL